MTTTNLWEERFIWLQVIVHHLGKLAEFKAEPMKECCLLACFFWFAQLPFSQSSSPSPGDGAPHTGLGHPTLNSSQKNTSQPAHRLILQLRFLLPRCVTLTAKINHHNLIQQTYDVYQFLILFI